ncbi:hypothetical protein L3X38_025120 [Prunus dulcis]|uniref:Uncharacterized protein n=1 Tax=Prunus dulcis TaxID=3755 RepID=A0AAD4Z618_PRUDU|nr:hypothetical protein L3X38_025120 [Prunus dulcis]
MWRSVVRIGRPIALTRKHDLRSWYKATGCRLAATPFCDFFFSSHCSSCSLWFLFLLRYHGEPKKLNTGDWIAGGETKHDKASRLFCAVSGV